MAGLIFATLNVSEKKKFLCQMCVDTIKRPASERRTHKPKRFKRRSLICWRPSTNASKRLFCFRDGGRMMKEGLKLHPVMLTDQDRQLNKRDSKSASPVGPSLIFRTGCHFSREVGRRRRASGYDNTLINSKMLFEASN